MSVAQESTKSSIPVHATAVTTDADSALGEIPFYFRVLWDRYTDCLKRSLGRFDVGELVRPSFGFVLFALFEEEVLRPSDICRKTGLKASTLTAIVDQMVKKGLVDRCPAEEDRRAIQLRLLPKGKQLRKACYTVLDETTEIICRGISKQNLEITKRAMRQMIKNMAMSD